MPKLTKTEAASELRKLAVLLADPKSTIDDCCAPLNSNKFVEALDMAIRSISPEEAEFPLYMVEVRFALAAESTQAATIYAMRIASSVHDGSQGHATYARVIE